MIDMYFIGLILVGIATAFLTMKIGACWESITIIILNAIGYFLIHWKDDAE